MSFFSSINRAGRAMTEPRGGGRKRHAGSTITEVGKQMGSQTVEEGHENRLIKLTF